jgi:hypothetical protein
LATGAWPSQHGIVADHWFDRTAKAPVQASGELLLSGTLAEQVARLDRIRAFVISLEAPQAGLFSGSSQIRQYWMNPRGQFTTLGEPPKWLVEFNALEPVENRHNAKWTAVDARTGAPPVRTLTYDAEHPAEFLRLYKASPLSQETQFGLAARLIESEKLGGGETTDFVTIIAGSGALLGHEEGADSPLMRQMTLELDRHMHFLMGKLDAAVGDTGYNLVLVGAHGMPPKPPDELRNRMAVNGELIASAIDKALQAARTGKVLKYIYPFLYLDPSDYRDPEPAREIASRAAMDLPAVAGYYTASGDCSEHDAWATRFGNSFHAKRSGDLMLSYRPGYVEEFGQNRGISYGSLYNYDVKVPLCMYGPSFRAGVFEGPVDSVDVAPTLARLLGVASPTSSVGRVLGEAFAE